MLTRLIGALCATVFMACGQSDGQEKGKNLEEGKKGVAVGKLISKGENFIEVRADGEEKARKYVPQWKGGAPAQGGGPDKEMLKIFRDLKVNSRVEVDWVFEERLRAVKVKVLSAPKDSGDKPGRDKPAKQETNPLEGKKGTIVGTLTAKAKNFIEVKGDGEERARKYFLHQGGSKKLLDAIHDTPVGSRVQVDWHFIEHWRVIELEVLKAAK